MLPSHAFMKGLRLPAARSKKHSRSIFPHCQHEVGHGCTELLGRRTQPQSCMPVCTMYNSWRFFLAWIVRCTFSLRMVSFVYLVTTGWTLTSGYVRIQTIKKNVVRKKIQSKRNSSLRSRNLHQMVLILPETDTRRFPRFLRLYCRIHLSETMPDDTGGHLTPYHR